jgi:hypothetical protein
VTPRQLLGSSLAAARAQKSVHYVSAQSSPGRNVRIVGDAAIDRGIQRITFRKGATTGHVTVLVVADTAYVHGDAFTLMNYMGLSSSYAGKWIRIPHSSAGFATVAEAVRLRSTIAELSMPPPLSLVTPTTVDGKRVVGIRSRFSRSGQVITETLYVRAAGAPLPVDEISRGGAVTLRVAFDSWGEPVRVSAPSHSVPLR